MELIEQAVAWIELHPVTADAIKWTLLLLIGWITGLFSFLRIYTKKPKLALSEVVSRYTILTEPHDGHEDAVKAIFLLNLEVVNPGRAVVFVNSFEIRFRRKLRIRSWSDWTSAISLPDRVRIEMGAGTKMLRNWFSHFGDELNLTIDGQIDPSEANSGYVLFVNHTWGAWNPRDEDGTLEVKCRASTAVGGKLYASGKITPMDADKLEEMVPGILDLARHEGSWNVPARF